MAYRAHSRLVSFNSAIVRIHILFENPSVRLICKDEGHCTNSVVLAVALFRACQKGKALALKSAVICRRGAAGPSKGEDSHWEAINLLVNRSDSLWCRARKRAVFLKPSAIVDSDSVRILFTTVFCERFLAIQLKPSAMADIP